MTLLCPANGELHPVLFHVSRFTFHVSRFTFHVSHAMHGLSIPEWRYRRPTINPPIHDSLNSQENQTEIKPNPSQSQ
jgi:hypothetical protein